MKILHIDYIKKHSRICCDCEDDLLNIYGDAAEEAIANYTNRGKNVDELIASLMEDYGCIPRSIMQAALMLVDVSYTYRSPLSPTNISVVPYTFDILIKPYMIL